MRKLLHQFMLIGMPFYAVSQSPAFYIKDGTSVYVKYNSGLTSDPVLTINGSIQNEGRLTGDGLITSQDLVNADSVIFNIGGLVSGTDYYPLNNAGTSTITGSVLKVILKNAYMPNIGDSFTLIDGGSLVGTFGSLDLPTLPSGLTWNTGYNATLGTVILSVKSTTLGVEYLQLNAQYTEGGNLITWQTASEVNNKGFDVEKMDNIGWKKIGFVDGKGIGSQYSFIDEHPQGVSYYRLKQVDNDGAFKYSKIISVAIPNDNTIQIYPTWVIDEMNIVSNRVSDKAQKIEIVNTIGQILYAKDFGTVATLNLSGLNSGVYIVRIYSDGILKTQKIYKQ